MLTPDDIFEKEFKRSMRGYDIDEVNEFLDQVIQDYAKLIEENQHLKKENQQLKAQLSRQQYHTPNMQSQPTANPTSEDKKIIEDLIRRVEKLERKTKYLTEPL
ncbi:DivIVA domain-containing protein [Tepidibacillus fermentans]|uniref:DivIVA domain-containing protein n=1 Tax=Tepidibacillus fermentans TaxID=1281767 RepID=A0A4R3KIG1_9BACI|nr:DivIVA domain-containing protein [Tepidibacillus fermentans]TCS83350.1 DivIVA domain-containing protein [Tepidibacillus fermentans]